MRTRRVEWKKDKRGDVRWAVVAGNGRKLATSGEGYKNQLDAVRGLAMVALTLSAYVAAAIGDVLVSAVPRKRPQEVAERCVFHPRYLVKRKPRVKCSTCASLWREANS